MEAMTHTETSIYLSPASVAQTGLSGKLKVLVVSPTPAADNSGLAGWFCSVVSSLLVLLAHFFITVSDKLLKFSPLRKEVGPASFWVSRLLQFFPGRCYSLVCASMFGHILAEN